MIENQAGLGLRLSEEDRKALGVGLAMHGPRAAKLAAGPCTLNDSHSAAHHHL